jgi:hypothetical protein
MRRSIFDSILEITDDSSVATVISHDIYQDNNLDNRYCLVLEYLYNDNLYIESYEFIKSQNNKNSKYSTSCISLVNNNSYLHFANIRYNIFIYKNIPKRKDVIKSINFISDNSVSQSYNIKYNKQIIKKVVTDKKELIYSDKFFRRDEIIDKIIKTNSLNWVINQMKQFGIEYLPPVDVDYGSSSCCIT